VLPLHEGAIESIANPMADESVADLAAIESITDPTAAEPLHSIVDPVTAGVALTDTSFLCVQVLMLS
jgi:hypothetical protein